MSNNPSFVLRSIEDVAYEERPVPESGEQNLIQSFRKDFTSERHIVSDTEVLVAIKKTGESSGFESLLIFANCRLGICGSDVIIQIGTYRFVSNQLYTGALLCSWQNWRFYRQGSDGRYIRFYPKEFHLTVNLSGSWP